MIFRTIGMKNKRGIVRNAAPAKEKGQSGGQRRFQRGILKEERPRDLQRGFMLLRGSLLNG